MMAEIERLLRTGPGVEEGSVYGYRCSECGGWWKVYQTAYHMEGCSVPVGGDS